MISQFFPPTGGVGSFRVAKFVKYLRIYGWEPIVLTVDENELIIDNWADHGLYEDLPKDLKIVKTKLSKRGLVNNKGLRWLPYLALKLLKTCRDEAPDLLFITANPFYPLIFAPLMKKVFRICYIVDLRDPWKLAIRSRRQKFRIGYLLAFILEPLIIRNAEKVICVSAEMLKEYTSHYKHFNDKFELITNGYDSNDFHKVIDKNLCDNFILYAGKFNTTESFRNPVNLFRAVKLLAKKNIDLKFVHLGINESEVISMVKRENISDSFSSVGPVPYYESLSYMRSARVLVIIGGGQLSEQTTKVFDYVASKKPILALVNKSSSVAKILRNIPYAVITSSSSPFDISLCLEKALAINSACLVVPKEFEDNYERQHLTKKLADIFDSVTK